MPTAITFSHHYVFGSTPPSNSTTYPSPQLNSNITISDLADGNANGLTAVGDPLEYNTGTPSVTNGVLYGFHNNGEPIIFVNSNYIGLSNSSNLFGSFSINFSGSGTYAYCFAEGTQIATKDGERAIETLAIGDLLRTDDGRSVAVKWVGRQTLRKMFTGPLAQMVCIKAGTMGNHTDLHVTGDHGMVVDGYVINASALVNGHSIQWVPLDDTPDSFTVYHVETEAHDVILANGTPSETYLDIPSRRAFDNYDEYLSLYGQEQQVREMSRPRITTQRILPTALRARLGIATQVYDHDLLLSA